MSSDGDTDLRTLNEVRELQEKVQQWRNMFKEMQTMPVDKNQGSNTAPAYSWYMYKYRGAFVAPRATCAPCSSIDQMDKASLGKYASQLCLETKECEQNTRNFAFLLKQPGNVVYHPSSVFEPGYCTPSLVVNGPKAFHDLVGAAVGDRFKSNKIQCLSIETREEELPLGLGRQ